MCEGTHMCTTSKLCGSERPGYEEGGGCGERVRAHRYTNLCANCSGACGQAREDAAGLYGLGYTGKL